LLAKENQSRLMYVTYQYLLLFVVISVQPVL